MIMQNLEIKIKNYQLNSGKTYMKYELDKYSEYQNYLYKRALYGLNALSEKELIMICSKKKQRILNVYKKAQTILNVFKQRISIEYTNNLFLKMFPNSSLTKSLLENTEIDEKFKNCLTFKDLNINKTDIISIFIKEGVLPQNFLSMEEPQNLLPRLKNETKA
jgi:hypothetical protein